MFCQQLLNEPKGAERAGIRVSFCGRLPARLVWDRVFNPGLAGRTPAATQQLYRFVWNRVFNPGLAGRTPAATQQLYRLVWDRVFNPVLRVEDPQPRNISSIGSCGTGSSTRVLRVEDPQPRNISSIGSCGTGSSTRSCGPKTRSHTTSLL